MKESIGTAPLENIAEETKLENKIDVLKKDREAFGLLVDKVKTPEQSNLQ